MKKNIFALITLMLLVLTSCSSDSDNPVTSNSVLLKKVIIEESGFDPRETTFLYDGAKLLKITYNGGYQKYSYTGDLITMIELFEDNNILVKISSFEYDSNNKVKIYKVLKQSGIGFKEVYTYETNGSVSFVHYKGDLNNQDELESSGIIEFQNGEVSKKTDNQITGHVVIEEFTFDTMNNPFKNITGFDKIELTGSFNSWNHNHLTFSRSVTGFPSHFSSYEYTYNSDNYPITKTFTPGGTVNKYFYQ